MSWRPAPAWTDADYREFYNSLPKETQVSLAVYLECNLIVPLAKARALLHRAEQRESDLSWVEAARNGWLQDGQ